MIRPRRAVGAVAVGAALLIAAVAGFIIVPEHKPSTRDEWRLDDGQIVSQCYSDNGFQYTYYESGTTHQCFDVAIASGPPRAAYDGLRILSWGLAIVGALFVAIGLIRYARPGPER